MNDIKAGVIGLGYVGLPLCVVMAEAGIIVSGFDIQISTCNDLNNGISHIKDIDSKRLNNIVKNKKFVATTSINDLKSCNLISICVPTPLNKTKEPDLSYVISATLAISKILNKGQLIILESTTYPGTTKDIMLPILEKTGLKVGIDFHLCFSPERVDPGNLIWHTKNTPKIIGGITNNCLNIGIKYYGQIFDKIVPVQNTEAAELIKVYENTFRMINIALANELSQVCDKLNLDVWSIIDAASTKPFGFMKFTPGPGLGGHCIPLDPHYLAWKMRTLSYKTKMIEVASEINTNMPFYIVQKISDELNKNNKSLNTSKILVIGAAYKKNIDDLRESPAIEIIQLLQKNGSIVSYHDDFCKIIKDDGHTEIQNLPLFSVELSKENIESNDLVCIVTDHDYIDFEFVVKNSKSIINTRGSFNKFNIIKN